MQHQVIIIHGGDVFATYEEYLNNLKQKEISLDRLRTKDWKANLKEELGEDFDVLNLKMPNPQNARFIEWKIWFEKFIPYFNQEVIFVGHSLGGLFLAKYLSENDYPKKIKATLLIAASYNTPQHNSLVDFTLNTPLAKFAQQGGKIILYHSKNDPVVAFGDLGRYSQELPNATLRIFEDRGHFNSETFPEIVEDIKKLAS
ncbi:MAG: hypothetical protein KatS3mg089_0160 [Patescibacteria group bacterium]|nr:MAG: hypothetical protein KatS3mg089_0160 [Patescibacteria group bacterium]